MSRIWTRAGSASLRQGWGDAVLRRLVQHGLWPSLHMCTPWGPALCLWWYRSSWGMLLRLPASEVAACWDLDSSRCKGVKWVFVRLKTTVFSFDSSSTDGRALQNWDCLWFRYNVKVCVCLAFWKERNNTDADLDTKYTHIFVRQ